MAGIVFAGITPHPPLIVPQVGQGQERAIAATIRSMEELAGGLARSQPEAVFLISPHGHLYADSMGVVAAASSWGNFAMWGAEGLDYDFPNDLAAVALLQEECRAAGVPLKAIGHGPYELDHGVMVPMYFLAKAMKGAPLVPLTFSWLSLDAHFRFGQALGQACARRGKRCAIVASGDLSHRLLPEAPAGYDPLGAVFDKRLAELVAAGDAQGVLKLDQALIERAGECGLRSVVILLGALDGLNARARVLSYEGPFGVGYMVASFDFSPLPPGEGQSEVTP